MASLAKQFSLFLILISLSSSQARESQFFNKASSTTPQNDVVHYAKQPQQQQQPDFLPETENPYGLYRHDPAAAATTTTAAETKQPLPKYLPENYNPVAYVTHPEGTSESTQENNFYDGPRNYENTLQNERDAEYRNYPATTNDRNRNYYNTRPEVFTGTGFNVGARANGFEPQGMSDTRVMENGKYYYDVNTERYNRNHPYESLKGFTAAGRNEYNNRNYYSNNGEIEYEFNGGQKSVGGYQNQYHDQFQDEEDSNLP